MMKMSQTQDGRRLSWEKDEESFSELLVLVGAESSPGTVQSFYRFNLGKI